MRPVVSASQGRILILGGSAEPRDPFHRRVTSWPGWRRSGVGELSGLPCSVFSCQGWAHSLIVMRNSLEELGIEVEYEGITKGLVDSIIKAAEDVVTLGNGDESVAPWPNSGQIEPYQYQYDGAAAIELSGYRALLADEMGVGKTITALLAMDRGFTKGFAVVPKSVKIKWGREVEKLFGEGWEAYVLDGPPKSRAAVFDDMIEDHSEWKKIGIINYELLLKMPQEDRNRLDQWLADAMLIFDECHRLRASSMTTKICTELAVNAPAVLGVSGTPAYNTVADLFNQCEIVRPKCWSSRADYDRRHVIHAKMSIDTDRGSFDKAIPVASKNLKQLNLVLNTFKIRRLKSEISELPPKVHSFSEVEMDGRTKRLYEAMRDYAVILIDEVLAENEGDTRLGKMKFHPKVAHALTVITRCHQITQGVVAGLTPELQAVMAKHLTKDVYRDRKSDALIIACNSKLKHVIEFADTVNRQGGSAVVFGNFNAPLEYLNEQMGDKSALITGASTAKKRQAAMDALEDGSIKVLLSQVALAEGWDATAAQDSLFLGRSWIPSQNLQAEDRLHRLGQMGTVNIQIPLVPETVDMRQHERLALKSRDNEDAMKSITLSDLSTLI